MKTNKLIFSFLFLSHQLFAEEMSFPMKALKFCNDLGGSYELMEIEAEKGKMCKDIICKDGEGKIYKQEIYCITQIEESSNSPILGPVNEAPLWPPILLEETPVVELEGPPCDEGPCKELTISDALDTLNKVEDTVAFVGFPAGCDPQTGEANFERDEPREFRSIQRSTNPRDNLPWDESFDVEMYTDDKKQFGFRLINEGVNQISGNPAAKDGLVTREWKFISKDGSKRETFVWITDDPGTTKLSDRMESVIVLFPRKVQPSIKMDNDDLVITLPTGEKVILDKKTKIIKSGVIQEAPVDTNKDKTKRKFAGLDYTGKGLTIRVDQRASDPRLNPKGKKVFNAIISQGNKKCEIPRKDLWSQNDKKIEFLFKDDNALLQFINSKCKDQFSF